MYIDPKYVDVALANATAKIKAQGVKFDTKALGNFQKLLKKVAAKGILAEDKSLLPDDWTPIFSNIKDLINGAVNNIKEKSAEEKSKINPKDFLLAAQEYLIALTSKEIGSPQINTASFRTVLKYTVLNIANAKDDIDISEKDYYEKQRGMDAKNLEENNVQPLIDAVKKGTNVVENSAKLFAEYKALAHRQKDHGFFWRMFHRDENKARNELLQKMEEALSPYAPTSFSNAETWTIGEFAKSAEGTIEKDNYSVAMDEYEKNPAKVFGYADLVNNAENKSKEENEVDFRQQLELDTKEKVVEPKLKEEKPKVLDVPTNILN